MLIVVDANVLCSGLLARGKTIDLLFSDKIDPIAPELLFSEFEAHRSELIGKSRLSAGEFNALFALLKKKIKIIPLEEFKSELAAANKLLAPHAKDTEYVALAMAFKCPLWSKEKLLKGIGAVEVLDADEVSSKIGV